MERVTRRAGPQRRKMSGQTIDQPGNKYKHNLPISPEATLIAASRAPCTGQSKLRTTFTQRSLLIEHLD
jgi:hypothetical protein